MIGNFEAILAFVGASVLAVYTSLFVGDSTALRAAFPDWRPPLPRPVRRTVRQPFTRKEIVVETREPDWSDEDPAAHVSNHQTPPAAFAADDESPALNLSVAPVEDGYTDLLERRVPNFVRSRPHWCTKNLTSAELSPLAALATGVPTIELEIALYARPSRSALLQRFAAEVVDALKTADEAALNRLAERWAARMSEPEFTHNAFGDRVEGDWSQVYALSILRPMVELARRCGANESVYLLTEC